MAYTPAGNLTSTATIAHLATVYYNRKALDQVKAMFRFQAATEPDQLPLRSGKTVQYYRYTLPGANVTPASEGTVGAGQTMTTTTVSATLVEYADFMTLSALLVDTAIDGIMANAADTLGYQAAITFDTITRTEFHSTTTPETTTLGAAMTVGDIRRAVSTLKASNVRPRDDGDFLGILHPYMVYDIQSDNTAGGFIDITKYAQPEKFLSGEVGRAGGCRMVETTNVKTSGTAPAVLYYNLVIGKGAVGGIDLAGRGPSKVEDPYSQSFAIQTGKGGPQLADPEGMIGGWVSYRAVYVAKILDTNPYRYRVIKADASLV